MIEELFLRWHHRVLIFFLLASCNFVPPLDDFHKKTEKKKRIWNILTQ